MKKQNGFIQIPIMVSIIIGVVLVGSTGYFLGNKKSATNLSQTTLTTENNSKILNNTEVKNENSTPGVNSQNSKITSSTASKTMDSVDARAMILSKYDQTISDIKVYFSTTYPDYQKIALKYPANYVCGTSCDSDIIKFQKERGEILKYIHTIFDPLVISFCDLNHSIQKEEDRAYCHGYFDFTRATNPAASTTLQRVMQDLKEWTSPKRAIIIQTSTLTSKQITQL